MLEHLRRGQGPDALGRRRILGRAEEEVILPVGLEPDRGAGVGIDALVDEGEREARLECIDPVVGGRMGILLALRLPVFAGGGLRGRELLLRLAGLDPSVAEERRGGALPRGSSTSGSARPGACR